MDKRNYFIDFIKFIMSIIIVLYHSWLFTGEYGKGLFPFGYLAVDFYFIVTGFLMMNSIKNKKNNNTLVFVYNKIKKLIPYILFSFIIGGLLLFGLKSFIIHFLFDKEFILELLQLGIICSYYPINSPTWFISAMIIVLFILHPLAVKFKDKYTNLIAPILLIFTIAVVIKFNINVNNPIYTDFFLLNGFYKGFIYILIGNIIYNPTIMFSKIKFNSLGKKIITFIEIMLYIILILNMFFGYIDSYIIALIFAITLIISFSNHSYTYNLFNNSFYAKLGLFGFILYLNNGYVRLFLVNNNYIYTYTKTLFIYLCIVFVISLFFYIFVPLILKLFNLFNHKIKELIIE